jgi:glycosyltransferase involved in cell wall biosynthesis
MPAYNEEEAVAAQVHEIREVLDAAGIEHEILVVDDGSTDRTAAEADGAGARVLQHMKNRGYGAAIKTGILAAANDAIVIVDADGTYPVEEIPALLAELGEADMVVGARTGEQVEIPLSRRPAKWFLRWLAEWIAGQPIADLNSGLRAFRRDCVKQYFSILSNRFSFTTTVTLAYMADDYHVAYHPINYRHRIGKSKIGPRHFIDFMVLIVRISMMFQPLKVFLPLAVFFIGLGLLKILYDVLGLVLRTVEFSWVLLFQRFMSSSALLLLMTGLQLLFIGMLADAVVRRIALHNAPLAPSHAVTSFHYSSDSRSGTPSGEPAQTAMTRVRIDEHADDRVQVQ